MSDQELRNQILDEILETIRGPKIPSHAFTINMAAERWNCSNESARNILAELIEKKKMTRAKRFGDCGYWYWPVEEE